MSNDSIVKTYLVAFLVCLVCSVLVTAAAMVRISREDFNKRMELRKAVLQAAGFQDELNSGKGANELFKANFEPKVVNLNTGEYTDAVDNVEYMQREAEKDPKMVVDIPQAKDSADIKKRVKYAKVYVQKKDGKLQKVVLPIRGAGMWGMMRGFIALESDLNTVHKINFYSHSETPGLGGEVDNPKWKAQWEGKKVYGEKGNTKIQVVKNGKFDKSAPDAEHTIDGLAGATVTSKKVSKAVDYWFSDHGFGKYLHKLQKG